MIDNRVNNNYESSDIACSAEFSAYGCKESVDDNE